MNMAAPRYPIKRPGNSHGYCKHGHRPGRALGVPVDAASGWLWLGVTERAQRTLSGIGQEVPPRGGDGRSSGHRAAAGARGAGREVWGPPPLRSAGTRSRGPTVPAPSFSRFPQTMSHRSKREPGSVVLRAPHTAAGLGRAGAHHAGLQGRTTGRAVGARAPGPPFPLRRVGAGRGSTGHLGAECSVCAHIYMSVDSLTMHAPTHAHTMCMRIHTCARTGTHMHTHAFRNTCIHTYTQAHKHAPMYAHAHTRAHAQAHACGRSSARPPALPGSRPLDLTALAGHSLFSLLIKFLPLLGVP